MPGLHAVRARIDLILLIKQLVMKAVIRKKTEIKVKSGWNRRNISFREELFLECRTLTVYFFGIPVFRSEQISTIPEN